MDKIEFQQRTRQFGARVVRLVAAMPRSAVSYHLGGQLLRAATSVPANYRAACRARSRAEFIAKLGIVEEEADESLFWLDFLADAGLLRPDDIADLCREGDAILRMTIASIKTARQRTPERPPRTQRKHQS